MFKTQELSDPASCMSRAKSGEMVFVLLARDKCAPEVVRAWVVERMTSGKNKPGDKQILDALECARIMEQQRNSGMFEIVSSPAEEALRSRTIRVIGTLDRSLSELKELALSMLDAADIQTVRHHAEDCVGLGNRVLEILKSKAPADALEPTAWAIYDLGSDELLETTPLKPEQTAGIRVEPLYAPSQFR